MSASRALPRGSPMLEVLRALPGEHSRRMIRRWLTLNDLERFDDRQRRMVNYQVTDYVENNDLVCFGLSSHEVEEWLPGWTPTAQRDLSVLKSWFNKDKPEDYLVRPATPSDYNWTRYATKAQVRCLLGLLVIRELPIKSFYARCWLVYGWLVLFVSKGLGRGLRSQRPLVTYNQRFHARALLNYPDLYWWNLTRVLPRNPPVPDAHREW
eukprot:CAMPEP_0170485220 /NCGR_PEP_ID=MMETSP0208-20121228/4533_1 /TAXON_ID=197538 /ORGANISM="Strombidium inclinatum, Strain S3" /LENGTH=209 /DNA_ID=CAMNT_0010758801 /DNA_START=40 /DNA_END=667 /DNA_ORIENTATION=+